MKKITVVYLFVVPIISIAILPVVAQTSYLAEHNPPTVAIVSPSDNSEVLSRSGERPSILVEGTAVNIPTDSRIYLVNHPINDNLAWCHEVQFSGGRWISQIFFGSESNPPQDGAIYQIFSTIRKQNNPLPETFVIKDQTMYNPTKVVTVKINAVSWFDKIILFGKEWNASGPFGAFFAAIGAGLAWIFDKYIRKKAESDRE